MTAEHPDGLRRPRARRSRLAIGSARVKRVSQGNRRRLRRLIEDEVRATAPLTGRSRLSPAVLDAIERVPRERFVSRDERASAWEDTALPIGHGQTISQPFVVALMTDLLDARPEGRILEIGTGSGYQSAVLAELVAHVWSVERIPELADAAAARLAELGYQNVDTRCADGFAGWPQFAPFDGVIVTAAAPEVPASLLEQLGRGGVLVIPVETAPGRQVLRRIRRDVRGCLRSRDVLPVAFVPLIPDVAPAASGRVNQNVDAPVAAPTLGCFVARDWP
ncbi:MAG: protein-L-isoaspartate(D-aspartate) O-methyltransferase [Pseudomonadales bacterium]